ncbi:hypothetical protein CV093_05170 [Oceanobacillus sp. 143]|nr:hypothetical protein CV093_05170 [Oceanobacillus sp. 143]
MGFPVPNVASNGKGAVLFAVRKLQQSSLKQRKRETLPVSVKVRELLDNLG